MNEWLVIIVSTWNQFPSKTFGTPRPTPYLDPESQVGSPHLFFVVPDSHVIFSCQGASKRFGHRAFWSYPQVPLLVRLSFGLRFFSCAMRWNVFRPRDALLRDARHTHLWLLWCILTYYLDLFWQGRYPYPEIMKSHIFYQLLNVLMWDCCGDPKLPVFLKYPLEQECILAMDACCILLISPMGVCSAGTAMGPPVLSIPAIPHNFTSCRPRWWRSRCEVPKWHKLRLHCRLRRRRAVGSG